MKTRILIAVAVLSLTACASSKQAPAPQPIPSDGQASAVEESSSSPIGQPIERDLTNARDTAAAGGDTIGAQCWTDILALHNRSDGLTLHGIASGIEATRLASKDTLLEKTRNDCAAVLFDLKLALLKFGLVVK